MSVLCQYYSVLECPSLEILKAFNYLFSKVVIFFIPTVVCILVEHNTEGC